MVFEKIFGRRKKISPDPQFHFGRYSDNNKSVEKVKRWTEADELFRNNKYRESIEAFFDYLLDESQENVLLRPEASLTRFEIYQGTKIVRGYFNETLFSAEANIALMPEASVPVMRKLLEMNFNLYYSRYALDNPRLCMRFDSELHSANPNKLYYGLKELATKADKQDDLLVQEFGALRSMDTEHVIEIDEKEKAIRFGYMQTWISKTLEIVEGLDAEKFSGGISYLLLTVAFRIDYLVSPEGKLLSELEKVIETYYRKQELPSAEKNQTMTEGLRKILTKTKEEVYPFLFKARHTFSIVSPQTQKTIADAINNALQNMQWYRDNQYPEIANEVMEYGLAYIQFSYSLPQPLNTLIQLFMHVNHNEYFMALGYTTTLYDKHSNRFNQEEVEERIDMIVASWKQKYPKLKFLTRKLKFDSLVGFNQSFCSELATLNFEQ